MYRVTPSCKFVRESHSFYIYTLANKISAVLGLCNTIKEITYTKAYIDIVREKIFIPNT